MTAKSIGVMLDKLARSQSGNIAIVAGLVLPIMVGAAGLGGDIGYWYVRERSVQNAADIAAYNAAVRLRSGATSAQILSAATTDAQANGWKAGVGTINIHTPPTSGPNQNPNAVEILLTETQPRFFSQILTSEPVNVTARAVGRYASSGSACLLALNKTASAAMKLWGNNTVTLSGCNIMSNSFASDSMAVGGSSVATVPCAIAVGQIAVSSTLNLTSCPQKTENAAPAKDPYKDLPAPPIPAAFTPWPSGNGGPAQHLCPGKYNGMSITNTKKFAPGVYVISGGDFSTNANAIVSVDVGAACGVSNGNGVTIYLTNGSKIQNINGGSTINLKAPTSGTYSGVLFYGDRTQPYALNKFNGNNVSTFTGALYFPSQEVQINGNFTGVNGCIQVIADKIDFSGSSVISANCPGTGMLGIPLPGAIALVE